MHDPIFMTITMEPLQVQPPLASAAKTMELLWSRIRQRGNLPGFSKAISAILAAMSGEDDREFSMTKTVLSDPTLTQRVLRLANSPMYSVFGQNINTVSKAVIVLGTDAIGHLALGLRLVEGLSSASSASDVARLEMEKSVLAGHIARQVASSARTHDIEEAVVCSMLHTLGRMMVLFYLPERWTTVQERMAEESLEESQAAFQVLGLGLDEIGQRVAKKWGLPAVLVNSIREFPPQPTTDPLTHEDWLSAISTMSSGCATVLCEDEASETELLNIASSYNEMLGIDTEQIMAAIDVAQQTANEEAVIKRSVKSIPLVKKSVPQTPDEKQSEAPNVLVKGVADMKEMTSGANSGQMLAMALETVYKGLGLSRAISFLHHPLDAKHVPRLFLGEDLQELLPKIEFSSAYQPDVFHAALANDKIVLVENPKLPNFASKLPRWWKESLGVGASSFIVLPLTIKRQSVGFIYGDWDKTFLISQIASNEVAALDELRAMVGLSVEQRRKHDPNWMI
jgi:HD-like signal output (HDOD) protein